MPNATQRRRNSRHLIAAKTANKRRGNASLVLACLVLPSLLAVGVAIALIAWRVPTQIDADLYVHRLEFTLGGKGTAPLLDNAVTFRDITVERFSDLRFTPKEMQITKGGGDESSWTSITASGAVVLRSQEGERSIITLEPADPKVESGGRLEEIDIQSGSAVVLEMQRDSRPALTIKVDGQLLTPRILPTEKFRLRVANVSMEPAQHDVGRVNAFRLRAKLVAYEPFIQMTSRTQGLILTLTPKNNTPIVLLRSTGIEIRAIEFVHQNSMGEIETAIAAPGTIKYPGFLTKASVSVDAHQFLGIKGLTGATITQLIFDPTKPGLQLRLQALAELVQTESGAMLIDHRLTMFDKLWHDARSAVLFSIVVWFFSVTLGGYNLYKVLNSD